MSYYHNVCGCYFLTPGNYSGSTTRNYLPQVQATAHTTIVSTVSKTVLKQTFINVSQGQTLEEVRYAFPLYDGVSVVDFFCKVGDRTIYGLVKEKNKAKKTYEDAKARGENAALVEQLPNAADVFITTVSNIPARSAVEVTLTYVGELKHDAEVDGIRFTIPTSIAPRYGAYPGELMKETELDKSKGMSLTIDVNMADGIPIKKIVSPSHPIEVALGTLSTNKIDEDPSLSRASATLALGTAQLENDFVLQIVAKDVGVPQAILETHPTISNQRALMTTLVPKFALKSQKPEIIFIADRSGSMGGQIPTLVAALKVFLKSIPVGCMFNICSFGSKHSFLWSESKIYDEETLAEAIAHVDTFRSDFGGTETLEALKGCVKKRRKGMNTELMLLTDGDIWSKDLVFKYVADETKGGEVRVFPIGIGGGVSSALIEGVARAGRGFAQMVANNEKLDSKIVRMLKGALTPHIHDYRLEVKYEDDSIETVADSLKLNLPNDGQPAEPATATSEKPISLYDPQSVEKEEKTEKSDDMFEDLQQLTPPKILQAPCDIPALFPFHRFSAYLLLSPEASNLKPKSVMLKGTSPEGPLQLEIPVEIRKEPGEMIHQLAARKAIQELEDSHGWVDRATFEDGLLINQKHAGILPLLRKRETVRLGVQFQVGSKTCSWVAVQANEAEIAAKRKKALEDPMNRNSKGDEDWEMLQPERPEPKAFRAVARLCLASAPQALRMSSASKGAWEEEEDDEDEDMGFGLFDDDDWTPATAVMKSAQVVPVDPKKGVESKAQNPRGVFMEAAASPQPIDFSDEDGDDKDADTGISSARFLRSASPPRPSYSMAPEEVKDTSTLLQHIIACQSFDGSWTSISKRTCKEMKIDPDDVVGAIGQLVSLSGQPLDRSKAEAIISTAVVIICLEKKLADEEDSWELVVDKAKDWLSETIEEGVVEKLWKIAQRVVEFK